MPRTSTTIDTRSARSPQIPPAITYRLSDDYFMNLGWTSVPNVSPVLPAVLMKAKFSHPVLSPWFQERESTTWDWYPDGRPLYVAREDGTGKIFYPNGKTAVVIERGGVNRYRTRLWVYGPGEIGLDGKPRPAQLCALFDSLGNGVVYDQCMNKRLVYNQTEGILWDSPTGVPIGWKWHNFKYTGSLSIMNEDDELNEAPEPSQDFSEESASSYVKQSPSEEKRYLDTGRLVPKAVSPLKPIVLQLNSYLSLRVWDQTDVSLTFFANSRHTRLQIGVLFNPFEKVKVAEIEEPLSERERVLCPFESFPPKTKSMIRLRATLKRLRACCDASK